MDAGSSRVRSLLGIFFSVHEILVAGLRQRHTNNVGEEAGGTPLFCRPNCLAKKTAVPQSYVSSARETSSLTILGTAPSKSVQFTCSKLNNQAGYSVAYQAHLQISDCTPSERTCTSDQSPSSNVCLARQCPCIAPAFSRDGSNSWFTMCGYEHHFYETILSDTQTQKSSYDCKGDDVIVLHYKSHTSIENSYLTVKFHTFGFNNFVCPPVTETGVYTCKPEGLEVDCDQASKCTWHKNSENHIQGRLAGVPAYYCRYKA
jgi:hypothetical protein